MQIGDRVLVPRTGDYDCEGEIIEVYDQHCRVKFVIGDYYRGKEAPPMIRGQYGYKTMKKSELKVVVVVA
jgi:hypothetical protein